MDLYTHDLPSTLEESLAACPKLRIVLIGNTGVGKSSLVSSVFNISLKDISHDRPGHADITLEYTSPENTRLILHDSKGFEAGSTENWNIVERFLRERSEKQLQDRVHAIWLCLMSPREGTRLLQSGEENILRLAKELNIPIIVVFTKYDLFVNELAMEAQENDEDLSEEELETKAEYRFNDRIKDCRVLNQRAVVKVSTHEDYLQRIERLQELATITCKCLIGATPAVVSNRVQRLPEAADVTPNCRADDAEELMSTLWITTQRMDAKEKAKLSIRQGFKKYWRNLGKSTVFKGQTLNRCLWRIHDDIVQVWNLNDPHKLLSNEWFLAKMISLVEPILAESKGQVSSDDFLKQCGNVVAAGTVIAAPFAPYLLAAGIGILAVKFLYEIYQELPIMAQYLGTYIVDLTCVLHRLFLQTRLTEPPIALSEELISKVVESHKSTDSFRIHRLVGDMNFMHRFDVNLERLILEYTSPQADEVPRPYPVSVVGDGDEQLPAKHLGRMTPNLDNRSITLLLADDRSPLTSAQSTPIPETRRPADLSRLQSKPQKRGSHGGVQPSTKKDDRDCIVM